MSSRATQPFSSRAKRPALAECQRRKGRICTFAVALIVALAPALARAQLADSSCTYAACSLNIVPRLTALDVVRGNAEARVGSLGFLFPQHVESVFAPSEGAQHHADAAFRRRRVAAVLTDAGLLLAAAAATRAVAPGHRDVVAAAGLATIAASIPIHFAADRELSRAVWEFNRRFSR